MQFCSYVIEMTEQLFDVAIVGAGPTGASLAIGLAQAGLQVAVIDARDPAVTPPRDGRNFAIVTGSWRLLDRLGIAAQLSDTSQPLNGLEATDGGTHFSASHLCCLQKRILKAPIRMSRLAKWPWLNPCKQRWIQL